MVNDHWVRLISPDWRMVEERQSDMLVSASFSIVSLVHTVRHNLANFDNYENRWLERYTYSVRLPANKAKQISSLLHELLNEQKNESAALLHVHETMDVDGQPYMVGAGYYYWEGIPSE